MITLYRNKTKLFSTEINKDSKFSRQLMSDDHIILKFSLLEPIKFELGDFCDCILGRYELVDYSNPIYNTSTGGYDYELRLDAEYMKWKNKLFQYRPQYGGLEASWFLTSTIDVFMQVFLSNLNSHGYKYKRETEYHVEYGDDVDLTKSNNLSFSNVNLIDALTQIAEKWETEWWITDNIIHIGKCQHGNEENALDFKVGVNVANMSSSASKADYITRLFVFGGTTNIPSRYRKKLEFDVKKTETNKIYDTARPLSVDMFRTVNVSDVKPVTLDRNTITEKVGIEKNITSVSVGKFTDKGIYVIPTGTSQIQVNITDPFTFWEKFYEEKDSYWGFYFGCGVDIKLSAKQEDKVIDTQTAHYTKDIFLRYDKGDIGAFKLPELKIHDSKLTDITLLVSIKVTLDGLMQLEFDHGVEPEPVDGKLPTIDVGASADKFTMKATLSAGTINIERRSAKFPVEVLSGTQKGKTDNAEYYEGADMLNLSSLSLALGDRYSITDNIIKPKVPSYYFTDDYQSEIVKTGAVEKHLMLPQSWNNGHNWIDAKENMSEEEIVEGVLVLDDIYPKAEYGVCKVVAYKIEKVDEKNRKTGLYDTYYLVASDDIALKKEYLLPTESNFKINFKDGSLKGMTFEFDLKEKGYVFENVVQEDGSLASMKLDRQYFHIFANENYGRLLPDAIIYPKVGDKFYILNYDTDYLEEMGIVSDAENELLEKGKEYMDKSKIDPNTYKCTHYWWEAQKTNMLPIGQRINLVNDAYFNGGKRLSRIIGMEGNLDIWHDNIQYTIGETAVYSRLGNIEDKLDEIELNGTTYRGNTTSGGSSVYLIKKNDSTPPTDTNAYSAARSDENYVSMTEDQTIKGNKSFEKVVNFLKGLIVNSEYSINEFGDAFLRSLQGKGFSVSELGEAILKTLRSADYDTAAQAGFGLMTRTDGKYKLSLTDLEVWGKAIFHELEIRKLSYSGGNYIFSPAGSTLMHVKEVRNQKGELLGWNCFFLADDGETATENLWKKGDLARCQSFNIKAGVYENVANKYYWREVVSVSKENVQITDDDGNVLYDGKKFGRVSLSATKYDIGGTDIPAAGDTIVCLGNRTQEDRQNAIIISTVGEDAPSFVQYCGIDDFTLQGKDVIVLSPKGNKLTGSFYSSAVSGELGSVLKQTMEGLVSEVSKRESEIKSVRSEIKQSADAISLKVEQTAEKDRNLLPNSYFQIGSRIFGVCHRKVMLEKGKSYALTLWGRIDPFMTVTDSNGLPKLVANTHKMRAHIWTENTSGTWIYDPYAEIGADNETGYATVKFNDVPTTGEYNFAIFPDVEINETNGEYMFYATCAQIEEIPNMQANGTAWSLGKKDPAIYGNLLPRLGGWTFGKNCILRPNEAEVEGHRLDVAGGANQNDTAGLDIIRLDGIELTSGETYTLSFWARGKGKFQTYLFNGSVYVCSYAIRDDGAYGLLKDGSIEPQRTLTMDWTRYSVTFSIKTGGAANVIPVRLAKGGSVNICGVKLEPFGRLTDFTDQNVTVEELEATGIDISGKKITATANTFEVKNNKGATTAKVNADGVFETNDIVCNGGTFKKINATDMTATGGTFTDITATNGTYKNIQVTENSWINSGKFCGEEQSDGTILGGFSIGDQGLVYDIPQKWLGTTKGASSNIAIKGANGNLSSKLGVIFDSNYLMGLELKVKYNSTDTPWGSYNVAAWLEASGNPQGQNYAFMGVGHGILRGMIEGTNFKQINLNTSNYGALSLQNDGNRWLFFPNVDASAYLPTKSTVAAFLGDTAAWSIRVMAICSPVSNHTITIRGRQTSGSFAEESMPQLYNYGRNTVAGIDVPPGKIVEILLVWDGQNYYAMHIKNNS